MSNRHENGIHATIRETPTTSNLRNKQGPDLIDLRQLMEGEIFVSDSLRIPPLALEHRAVITGSGIVITVPRDSDHWIRL